MISRPGAHDVGIYRGHVDARMRDLVRSSDEGTLAKATSSAGGEGEIEGGLVEMGHRLAYIAP